MSTTKSIIICKRDVIVMISIN